jgi:hypothetical protein
MSGDHVRGKRTVTARRRSLAAEAAAVGAAFDLNVEDTTISTPARGEARRGRAKTHLVPMLRRRPCWQNGVCRMRN